MKKQPESDSTKPGTIYNRKWRKKNREHIQQYSKEWYEANREKHQLRSIAWKKKNNKHTREHHWRAQGIDLTHAEYETLLKKQKYRCVICAIHIQDIKKKYGLVVDHDHTSGVVRGLLCHQCNAGLGFFYDSPERLAKARKYLLKRRA